MPAGDNWFPTASRMLEIFSRTWGGAGNILVPMDKNGGVEDRFWRILKAFDPDVIAFYEVTRRGQQLADPEGFAAWLERETERLAKKQNITIDGAKEILDSNPAFMTDPYAPWKPSEELRENLLRWISPRREDENLILARFRADSPPGRGLVDMGEVEGINGQSILVVTAPDVDWRLQAMLLARVGGLSPSHRDAIGRSTAYVEDLVITDPRLALAAAFPRPVDTSTLSPRFRNNDLAGQDLDDVTPIGSTLLGCRRTRRFPRKYEGERPVYIVVGGTDADFYLGLVLNRMYESALWVHEDFFSTDGEVSQVVRRDVAMFIGAAIRWGTADIKVILTSVSMSVSDLEKPKEQLTSFDLTSDVLASALAIVPIEDLSLPTPNTIHDAEATDKVRYEPFFGPDCATELDTPVPSAVTTRNRRDLTWYVDVLVDGYQPPPRGTLSEYVIAEQPYEWWCVRCSNTGISYFSERQGWKTATARLDQVLLNPKIRLPDAREIFDRLLEVEGLRSEYSSAGRYTRATIDIWGGLDALAADFRNAEANKLLQAFRSTAKSSTDPGVFLTGTKRRYLSLEDVVATTGLDDAAARRLVDRYVLRGALERGICLQCPECSFAGWYPIELLGTSFRCGRCRKEAVIIQPRWKDPVAEPIWYYELAEVVYQAVNNDIRAPILTLDVLRRDVRAFDYVPEMDVEQGGNLLGENDIWAIADGRIIVGEAKTTDRLASEEAAEQKKIDFIIRLAEATTADEVVCATSTTWREETKEKLNRAFSGMSYRLRILEAKDLIGGR